MLAHLLVKRILVGSLIASAPEKLCSCAAYPFAGKSRPRFARLPQERILVAMALSNSGADSNAGGLEAVGNALVIEAETLFDSSRVEQDLIQSAGRALIVAGESWTVDWTDVTIALADAAESFSKVSLQLEDDDRVAAKLFGCIAQELEDASNISGCTSIGPASSVPNLEAIRDLFVELDKLTKSSDVFLDASSAIESLIEKLD